MYWYILKETVTRKEKIMEYTAKGVCAKSIRFEIGEKDGRKIVHSVKYNGGCDGNHKGIESLVEGMYVDEVISRLEGIRCGLRTTSCPDQLAQALKSL